MVVVFGLPLQPTTGADTNSKTSWMGVSLLVHVSTFSLSMNVNSPEPSHEQSRKRCRPHHFPQQLRMRLTDKERSKLLSSIEGTSEDEGSEPLANRKFIPMEETRIF